MTVAIILCATVAGGLTVQGKRRYQRWWQQWFVAFLSAAGASMPGLTLVGGVEMVEAACCGAFLGLCWNP